MMITMTKTFLKQLILVVISKLFLEYLYIFLVHPVFEYAGFGLEFNLAKYVFSWVVYLGAYLVLHKKRYLNISEIYFFVFILWYLPNTVFYGLASQNTMHFIALSVPFVLIVLLTTQKSMFKTIPTFPKSKLLILFLSLFVVVLVIINYYLTTGGRMVWSFYEVYNFRGEFGESSGSGIFGYLNSWAAKIFSVVLLSWAIYKKKYLYIAFSIALIILLFALSGHKGALTGVVLAGFFCFLFKLRCNKYNFLLLGFLGLMGVVLFLHILEIPIISSLIVRRLLMVPAHLNFVYLEFFSHNEFVYWANSVLKSVVNNPYNSGIAQTIGAYLGNSDMAANTGFLASGFANAGYLGIVVYTLMAIILFNIINQLSRNNDKYFVMTIMFPVILTLFKSSDLLTTLFTHGLLIAIITLWMFNNKTYKLKLGRYIYEI